MPDNPENLFEVVDKAFFPPAKCIVSADIDGPFIDLGCWANMLFAPIDGDNPRLYLHTSIGEKIGRSLDMVPKAEVEKLTAKVEEYGARVAELERLVEAYQSAQEAAKVLAEAVA